MKHSAKSLYAISVEYVSSYLFQTVSYIYEQYNWENDQALCALAKIRRYLIKNLHPHIIDHLLNSTIPPKGATEYELAMVLKIYMHKNMKRFQPKFKVPCTSGIEGELLSLSRLVVLSLHLVCTDEILEVVGKNCPSLEGIDIVSKIGTYWPTSLNALKLRYYVSDEGVKHLHRCRRLKRIVMRKIIGSSSSGGKRITNKGIVELLTKLPDLQFIRYNDMGYVFQDFTVDMRLNLHHVHDDHTCPEHMEKIIRHCPKLKGMCITFSRMVNDVDQANSCLKLLANSELSLSTLYMKGFSDSQYLINFFEIKGDRLTALSLSHHRLITFETLKKIGELCPKLRYFEFFAKMSHCSMSGSQIASLGQLNYYQNLESLKIIGHSWKPKIVFPLLLHNASRLKFVVLVNWDYHLSCDKEMALLMSRNRLACLEQFRCLGLEFQLETLFQFVNQHHKSLRTTEIRGKFNYNEFLQLLNEQGNFGLEVVQNVMHVVGNCFCYDL